MRSVDATRYPSVPGVPRHPWGSSTKLHSSDTRTLILSYKGFQQVLAARLDTGTDLPGPCYQQGYRHPAELGTKKASLMSSHATLITAYKLSIKVGLRIYAMLSKFKHFSIPTSPRLMALSSFVLGRSPS